MNIKYVNRRLNGFFGHEEVVMKQQEIFLHAEVDAARKLPDDPLLREILKKVLI